VKEVKEEWAVHSGEDVGSAQGEIRNVDEAIDRSNEHSGVDPTQECCDSSLEPLSESKLRGNITPTRNLFHDDHTAGTAPTPLRSKFAEALHWLEEDEAGMRRETEDSESFEYQRIQLAHHTYMVMRYNWSSAVFELSPSSDPQLFASQRHLPQAMRLPLKDFYSQRLGLLERMERDAGFSMNTSIYAGQAARIHSAKTRSVVDHRPVTLGHVYPSPPTPIPSPKPPTSSARHQRVVNSGALQALLFDERHHRELIELMHRRDFDDISQRCKEHLRMSYNWAYGVHGANVILPPKGPEVVYRHLPPHMRSPATAKRPSSGDRLGSPPRPQSARSQGSAHFRTREVVIDQLKIATPPCVHDYLRNHGPSPPRVPSIKASD
jgi:hypothetical protein